ncbi:hypothetical protein PTSG_02914 [Salpingoeca rosetta]|uniref:Uncharacterized protein n=1 Tax=Salpingoeca rosetta (strain ATCC 50818 / BSB-021) TaxID=946362 RepID=F2U3P9_SALR5|nr:uncharacterized protein PTSG_02914 [Salpingoeca rosetta]EGD82243.1 hypothetical protein PTSG_02914 [Salpingoeca rosetta]|eukprot:XP_004996426.1 hypothetical protein PTSG_02914 [Salpingoeca rosetta]
MSSLETPALLVDGVAVRSDADEVSSADEDKQVEQQAAGTATTTTTTTTTGPAAVVAAETAVPQEDNGRTEHAGAIEIIEGAEGQDEDYRVMEMDAFARSNDNSASTSAARTKWVPFGPNGEPQLPRRASSLNNLELAVQTLQLPPRRPGPVRTKSLDTLRVHSEERHDLDIDTLKELIKALSIQNAVLRSRNNTLRQQVERVKQRRIAMQAQLSREQEKEKPHAQGKQTGKEQAS